MKISALLFLALLSAAHAAGDNGSSGIGSAKTPIVDDIWVPLPTEKFKLAGNNIVRVKDEAIVLKIEPISAQEAREKKSTYNSARLGTVKAWEFIPDRENQKNLANAWLVCGTKQACAHVTAGPDSGFEAGTLLGLFSK